MCFCKRRRFCVYSRDTNSQHARVLHLSQGLCTLASVGCAVPSAHLARSEQGLDEVSWGHLSSLSSCFWLSLWWLCVQNYRSPPMFCSPLHSVMSPLYGSELHSERSQSCVHVSPKRQLAGNTVSEFTTISFQGSNSKWFPHWNFSKNKQKIQIQNKTKQTNRKQKTSFLPWFKSTSCLSCSHSLSGPIILLLLMTENKCKTHYTHCLLIDKSS